MNRDYSSISPSAGTLLLTKALTNIPFAKPAAAMVYGQAEIDSAMERLGDDVALRFLLHFEERYRSIDCLMAGLGAQNILEISSGFSFRGLNLAVRNPGVHYIDTDLPEITATKTKLVDQLIRAEQLVLKGGLLNQPLNVLDEAAFIQTISSFKSGPVTLINEGLLMYLNTEEKIRLCAIIHPLLKQRGGYWITGDIYVKKELGKNIPDHKFGQFLKDHNVEENKFDSFEQAESFFHAQGFKIHQRVQPEYHQLTALRYFSSEQLIQLKNSRSNEKAPARETWVLVAE